MQVTKKECLCEDILALMGPTESVETLRGIMHQATREIDSSDLPADIKNHYQFLRDIGDKLLKKVENHVANTSNPPDKEL